MRRSLVVPVLLVALVAVASTSACGGSPSAGGNGTSPSRSAGPPFQEFAKCMRDHGQNVPDPDPNAGGGVNVALTPPAAANRSAWDSAMSACRQFLPGGGEAGAVNPQELEGLRAYAVCMRDHGVEVTDPDPSTGKSQFQGRFANATKDQILNDPTYKTADEACKDKLTSGGAGKQGGK